MRASLARATIVLIAALPAFAAVAKTPPSPDLSLDVYAEPAQLVDIGGGRKLNLRCSGSGSPTVILDIGRGMTSMSWRKVQPLVAKTHRVCSYDRAGYGFSDSGPPPRTVQAEADDLHALVHAARLETPLVLVGHSMASYIVRVYASAYPEDIIGLVLVDPVSETLAQDAPAVAEHETQLGEENIAYAQKCLEAARKGELDKATPAAQACVPPPFPELSQRLSDVIRQRYRNTAFWESSLSEGGADAANIAAVKSAPVTYAALPLIVLSAEGGRDWVPPADRKASDAAYTKGHRRIAALSSRGVVVPVAKASHDIQEDRPQAIADAIAKVIQQIGVPASSARSEPRK